MSAKIALGFALTCLVALITTWILVPYFPQGHPSTGLLIFIVTAFVSTIVSCFGLTIAVMAFLKERRHPAPHFAIPVVALVLNALIFTTILTYAFWLRHEIIVAQNAQSSTIEGEVPNVSGLIGPE